MVLKNKILSVIFTGIFLLSATSLYAAWWEKEDMPMPQGTAKIKQETRRIAGADYELNYYVSDQSPEQIKDFYRNQMTGTGWKEVDMYKKLDTEGMARPSADYLDKARNMGLMFQNDDQMLSFSILPEGIARDGRTHFTVTRGNKPQLSADNGGIGLKVEIPELVAQPKKNVYPVYPEARLISLSEKEHSLSATYMARDDIEYSIDFYKKEMSKYGWFLSNERPIIKTSKVDSAKALNDCPSCKQFAQIPGFSLEVWSSELVFSNVRQDTCRLTFAQAVPQGGEQYASLGMTTITVDYAEKTR